MGGLQAQSCEHGRSSYLQKSGDLVSGPRGGHGAASFAAPQAEPVSEHEELEGLRTQGGAQRRPPCAQYRHVIHRRVRRTALEALQRCGTGRFLPSGREAGREEIKNKEEMKEEELTGNMVSTITFLQVNLQHSTAASGILTRTVGVTGVDMALIQEPWYRDGCVGGLGIPGYTLYTQRGNDRPRACILARNMNIWELPGFSCRDLEAVLVKYDEDGAERRLVLCSAYLPYDSEDPPCLGSWTISWGIVKMRISSY